MIVRRYMLGLVVAAAALGNSACSAAARAAAPAPDRDPAWAEAHQKPPMTADQTRAFIMRLARFVVDQLWRTRACHPDRS